MSLQTNSSNSATPPLRAHSAAIIAVSVMGVFCVIHSLVSVFSPNQLWENSDFIEYWTAYRVASSGLDPYAPENLTALQQQLGRTFSTPLMMWNPPWSLVVLEPLLLPEFKHSALLWTLSSVLALVFLWVFGQRVRHSLCQPGSSLERTGGIRENLTAYALVSFPIVSCLMLGQLSLFLALFVALGAWLLMRGKSVAAGFCFSLLTIKLHLFVPLLIGIVIMTVRKRDPRVIIGLMLGGVTLLALTWLRWPHALAGYRNISLSDVRGAVAPLQWVPGTMAGAGREVMNLASLERVQGFNLSFVLFGIISATSILLQDPREHRLERVLCPLLALGIVFAPFGWVFDFVVVLPGLLLLPLTPRGPSGASQSWLIILSVFLNLICYLSIQLGPTNLTDFWWLSLLPLILWIVVRCDTPSHTRIEH